MPITLEQSLGQKRVRTQFNPAATSVVDQIKQKSAELIDLVKSIETKEEGTPERGEFYRLQSLAMTAYEEGAMWAVKAATL